MTGTSQRTRVLSGMAAAACAAVAARLTGIASGEAATAASLIIGYLAFSIASGTAGVPYAIGRHLGAKPPRKPKQGEALSSFAMAACAALFTMAASMDALVTFMAAIGTYGASQAAHAATDESESAMATLVASLAQRDAEVASLLRASAAAIAAEPGSPDGVTGVLTAADILSGEYGQIGHEERAPT